jgi:hypothetical protein
MCRGQTVVSEWLDSVMHDQNISFRMSGILDGHNIALVSAKLECVMVKTVVSACLEFLS